MKATAILKENTINSFCAGKLTSRQASRILHCSRFYVYSLSYKFKQKGKQAFIHALKGRKSNRALPPSIEQSILDKYNTDWRGVNFRYFTKLLPQLYSIKVSESTVRHIMEKNKIRSPLCRRKRRVEIHKSRARRARFGELVQIDASLHQWLASEKTTIHGAIDDATGKILALYMDKTESLFGYLEMTKRMAYKFGIPMAIYSDASSIFCKTNKAEVEMSEKIDGWHRSETQWKRICDRLVIDPIFATTPQAKGRIERLWQTLQHRLPYIFAYYGINDTESANAFLEEYIDIFNAEFSVEPESPINEFVPAPPDIENILMAQYERQVDAGGCFSFHNYTFLVDGNTRKGQKIAVCVKRNDIFAIVGNERRRIKLITAPTKSHAAKVMKNIFETEAISFSRRDRH